MNRLRVYSKLSSIPTSRSRIVSSLSATMPRAVTTMQPRSPVVVTSDSSTHSNAHSIQFMHQVQHVAGGATEPVSARMTLQPASLRLAFWMSRSWLAELTRAYPILGMATCHIRVG